MKKLMQSRNTGLIIVLIILLILARILTPNMFGVQAIINMIQNNMVYALLAVGEMVVILTGGIDISIGSTLAFVAVLCTQLQLGQPDLPGIIYLLAGIFYGVICGAINGFLVGYLHMVPMICTLGTMYIFRGLAFAVSDGAWWFAKDYIPSYRVFAIQDILGVPAIIWLTAIIFILIGFFLGYTSPGRRIYAIGTAEESSAVAGIRKEVVCFYAYIICGAMAGLSGMMFTANYAGGYYGIAESYEMTAIAICVLGGVSITGGKGSIDGVVIGVLIMSVITNFISMIPGMSVWQKALQGGIIIVAVIINYFTEVSAEKRALKERGALI